MFVKQGKPLQRKTPLRSKPSQRKVREILRSRQAEPKKQPRGPEKGTINWALQAPFKAKRPARTQRCVSCKNQWAHHWHHWLAQQHIRNYMRFNYRRLFLTPETARTVLGKMLRDERNLSPYCQDCHLNHESWSTTRLRPPESAYEFANELGSEWLVRLQRAYSTSE